MCGIFGYLAVRGRIPDVETVLKSLDTLRHRGPDDSGFATFDGQQNVLRLSQADEPLTSVGRLGLGVTRLSILDPSNAAHQPFVDPKRRYVLVYNGEIYNYRELRQELEAVGHRFRSSGDTEVLLRAYETWGKDCLAHFEGMFAFAMLDIPRQILFLARDPFGIKPLYYTEEGGFYFASQLGGLLTLSGCSRSINTARLARYLATGWSDSTDQETLLLSVQRFPAGCAGTIPLDGSRGLSVERYWKLSASSTDEKKQISFLEAAEKLRELFLASVDCHLRADAPIASALSGGVDSSSIVAAMRQIKGDNAEIHTISFLSPGYEETNEEPWIRVVAKNCRTIEHQVLYSPSKLVEAFDRFVFLQDWPAASPVIYAQQQVFETARAAGFKVMLSGQGPDEYMAGYPRDIALRAAVAMRAANPLTAARLLLRARSHEPFTRLALTRQAIGSFLQATRDAAVKVRPEIAQNADRMNAFRSAIYRGLFETPLPGILRIEDCNSMAWSVENRLPFLTPKLAAFVLSLPDSYLVSADGETKAVFRAAMRGITPDEVLDRRMKMGFPVPIDAWLRALESEADRWIESAASLPCLQADVVRNTWKRFRAKPAERQGSANAFLLWRWIFLAGWAQQFNVRFE